MQAGRPRYSFVFKLVMHPKNPKTTLSIARPEWGEPVKIGSASDDWRKKAEREQFLNKLDS